jgi:hypothetical protein
MADLHPLPRQRSEVAITVEGQAVDRHIADQIGVISSIAHELTDLHHDLKRLSHQTPELANLYARLESLAEGCANFGVVRYSRSDPNPRPYHNYLGQPYSPYDGYPGGYVAAERIDAAGGGRVRGIRSAFITIVTLIILLIVLAHGLQP